MKVIPAKKSIERSEADLNNSGDRVDEYGDLKFKLYAITLLLTGVIGLAVWGICGSNLALNYLLGAIVGVVYLRMLAKDIDRVGKERKQLIYSKFSRFVLVSVAIVAAARAQQLHILPVFLGFMTYKVAILVYTFQDLMRTRST
ncbi:ATP synthase subunit I [Pseudanabaena sp. PCC 6802]|uniref:ATP synthase subunit I n=1 Tax=Pseudanabaena sp. PCC 6802 TaxID=118173 RepID=UPI000349F84D|nr:ATP synthase subunit I [Pseudanabaena sp. PCC 6802]